METVGHRIKKLRKVNNWTQKQFANRINVSAQKVSNWERDYTPPSAEDVARIAEVCNTNSDYILFGRVDPHLSLGKEEDREKSRDELLQDLVDDPDDFFFLDGYLEASEEEKKELRRYMYEIKKQMRQNNIRESRPPSLFDITEDIKKARKD